MDNPQRGQVENERNPTPSQALSDVSPSYLARRRQHEALARQVTDERDPLTPALLREARLSTRHYHLTRLARNQDLYLRLPARPSAPPSGGPGTPATSLPEASPSAQRRPRHPSGSYRTDRQIRGIAKRRIWATGCPQSAEALAETVIIGTVLARCRRRKDFTGWAEEAQDYIALCIPREPTKREALARYSRFRSLIRTHRRSWMLAEHITDLDAILDKARTL